MCGACSTMVDVAGTNAVVATVMLVNVRDRVAARVRRRPRLEVELATWEDNAAFVGGLGLDPLCTLGPPPAVPASALDDATGEDVTARTWASMSTTDRVFHGASQRPVAHLPAVGWFVVSFAVYVVLGLIVKSWVLNWIVGPLWLLLTLYLLPAAVRWLWDRRRRA